jgi:hypothetical protein
MHKNINLLDNTELLVSAAEVAKILEVNAKTVTEWARNYPDFPAVRLPGVVRMRLSGSRGMAPTIPRKATPENSGT